MKKKIIGVLLSAAMVATMAMGCGSSGSSDSSAKTESGKAGKAEDMTFVVVPKCVHAWFDEVNKGATMGMDAISYVSEKVKDNDFKEVLNVEYNKYQDISNRVNDLYNNYSNKEPHETNTMTKMMTWYGIQMKTMTDDSTSKLSELLMQGTNM